MQPDTLIPDLSNPQAWNRFSYVGNRPVNFNDPSGHNPCAGAASGYKCHRERNKARLESLRRDENNPSVFSTILDRYMLGWENFGSALSTVKNPNAPALFKAYSYTYIAGWGGAHAAAAIGVVGLACVASGPGCVKVVEGTLGIGASVSADGDPTNEIRSGSQIVSDIARGVADKTGGILKAAQGDGWRVTLPRAAENGRDIVARIMNSGGVRHEPYFRVAVQNLGPVTSNGVFSSNPLLTHHLIDIADPAGATDTIVNLMQGLVK